jgi:hypothetical protein
MKKKQQHKIFFWKKIYYQSIKSKYGYKMLDSKREEKNSK